MDEYIGRADFMNRITSANAQAGFSKMTGREAYTKIIGMLNNHPTADVATVTHAHVVVNWLGDCHCSNCGDYCDSSKPFCASCGARFDEPEMRED